MNGYVVIYKDKRVELEIYYTYYIHFLKEVLSSKLKGDVTLSRNTNLK